MCNLLCRTLQAVRELTGYCLHCEGNPALSTAEPAHQFPSGRLVMGKRVPAWILGPGWKGPYPTILITPTIAKVAGIIP